jgi:chromosome segregation ATPase
MLAQLRDVRRREALDRLASDTAQADLQLLRDRVAELERELDDLRRHGAELGRQVHEVGTHVGRLVEIRTANEDKIASLRARLRRKDERLVRLRRALDERR